MVHYISVSSLFGHYPSSQEVKVLQVEANIIWRKYKEAAHMAVAKEPISQPSLEMSPIWTTLINEEVSKLHTMIPRISSQY
jgi:hypothetical protein